MQRMDHEAEFVVIGKNMIHNSPHIVGDLVRRKPKFDGLGSRLGDNVFDGSRGFAPLNSSGAI